MQGKRKINFGRMTNAEVSTRAKEAMSGNDFGYLGHERANEAHDRVQRTAYPGQVAPRAAYSYIIGDPVELGPADYAGAREILRRIEIAMDKGGWTRNEWRRLRSMYDKWKKRAEGKDERFNVAGNKQGAIPKRDSRHIQAVKMIRMLAEGGEVD